MSESCIGEIKNNYNFVIDSLILLITLNNYGQ